jgi:hypothetical protein
MFFWLTHIYIKDSVVGMYTIQTLLIGPFISDHYSYHSQLTPTSIRHYPSTHFRPYARSAISFRNIQANTPPSPPPQSRMNQFHLSKEAFNKLDSSLVCPISSWWRRVASITTINGLAFCKSPLKLQGRRGSYENNTNPGGGG